MNPSTGHDALPEHATIVARSDVWIDSEAVKQFVRVANFDRCIRAVGMPDLHPGRGIPVGAVFAFDGRVHP